MKSFLAIIVLISLAVMASCQINLLGNNRQKPGTCYRPVNNNGYRYRRSADPKTVEKRQFGASPIYFGYPGGNNGGGYQGGNGIGGGNNGGSQGGNGIIGGGSQGGNGWGNTKRCYNDYDCTGNKKCCSGNCQTPSFVG